MKTYTMHCLKMKQQWCCGATQLEMPKVVISKTVKDKNGKEFNVEHIGYQAFFERQDIESVDLSGCINLGIIGKQVFSDCKNLKSINLSGCKNLSIIEMESFYGCIKLESVDLSDCKYLNTIDKGAFFGCYRLTSVDLSKCDNLERVEKNAFFYCKNLKKIFWTGKCGNGIGARSVFPAKAEVVIVDR